VTDPLKIVEHASHGLSTIAELLVVLTLNKSFVFSAALMVT